MKNTPIGFVQMAQPYACCMDEDGRYDPSLVTTIKESFLPYVPAWQAFQFTKPRANLEFSCKSTIQTCMQLLYE